ncbi:MAG: hemerythrin domain-containing protein [Acidobacteria bacterium]|nr:hemerythrin domain-containing protein [Acidobacteriota bacterium]
MTQPNSLRPPEPCLPDDWRDLGALAGHIVAAHHRYVREAVPDLTRHLRRLVLRQGLNRPELSTVEHTFAQLGPDLLAHLDKEEHILFPYICELATAESGHRPRPLSPFGTIANPLRMMEEEHLTAMDQLIALRDLTSNYTPPAAWPQADADCYAALARFDADFQRHVYLENTLLFPRALDLESRLS